MQKRITLVPLLFLAAITGCEGDLTGTADHGSESVIGEAASGSFGEDTLAPEGDAVVRAASVLQLRFDGYSYDNDAECQVSVNNQPVTCTVTTPGKGWNQGIVITLPQPISGKNTIRFSTPSGRTAYVYRPSVKVMDGTTSLAVTHVSSSTQSSFAYLASAPLVMTFDYVAPTPTPTPTPTPAPTPTPTPAPTGSWSANEWQIVHLTNLERRKDGKGPLKGIDALQTAMRGHTDDMAAQNYFDHTSKDGRNPGQRMSAAGYQGNTWGENIAAGSSTPQGSMDQWMNSAGHKANILNGSFTEIGVGYTAAPTSQYRHYWGQAFGARSGVYNVIIADENPVTSTDQVELYVYGSGWATDMMVSNDPAFAGASWQPYRTTLSWTLASGAGAKTVYVKLRNGTTIKSAQDSITRQ